MTVLRRSEQTPEQAPPDAARVLGNFQFLPLSDTGGLTQFGAFVETLDPGARSSDRHWHEEEDEFLYMLSGTATVIEDEGTQEIGPGDSCCWPKGVANGHHVVNKSAAPCSYLIVGTRLADDIVHYSEIDKILIRENGQRRLTRRDGTPIEGAR
ncbi:cupin domain-containing protein [Pseudoruegeria sp. HB172150]|uniref:cupin domain-containing protein n=1 Tax=Pseudoruegeria sp. HB172150 TaxID=2721164 RepID=UPI00155330F5|nr:cupin domain-containing protein [Pseudoruegeria sp. HB172150]